MARVLVSSMPSRGHLHPVVPVARSLVDAGHEVLWATGPDGVPLLQEWGFAAVSAGEAAYGADVPGFAEALQGVAPRERRAIAFGTRFAATARARRVDLARVADDFRPDLMMHDLAELAAPAVATARRIPKVTIAFSGPLPERLLQRVVEEVADVWQAEGQQVPADAGLHDGIYVHRFPPALGPVPPSAEVQRVRPVGFDGASARQAPAWVSELGIRRPAVYVSLGTVAVATSAWAAILAALASLDVDAVATTGTHVDSAELGPVPPNVRVERYVPQSYVLDKVSAVVSHAGAGTMLAAAERGLPQVCLPLGADMWDNADALSGAGAGITLEEGQRSPDAVRSAVERALSGGFLKAAAERLRAEITEMPHPDEIVPRLEALAGRR